MSMDEMTHSSEHSVVMKCRRVHLEQERGCLREGTLFTEFEDTTVISHKMTPNAFFVVIVSFLPFFRRFGIEIN